MRISDWSSDVCSSDLGRRSCEMSAPNSHASPFSSSNGVTGSRWDHSSASAAKRPRGSRPLWTTPASRSEEHTSELQSLMRISYAVFCLKKKKKTKINNRETKSTIQKRRTKQSNVEE